MDRNPATLTSVTFKGGGQTKETIMEIFLVEDNFNEAELLLYALRKLNIANRIHHAHDGAEALAYFFGPRPDGDTSPVQMPRLILLDLKLPKVNGQEVLRQLKASPDTRAIPVVILTSSNEERDIAECYQLGVNSYIVKPIDFDQFKQAVHDLGVYWLALNRVPSVIS